MKHIPKHIFLCHSGRHCAVQLHALFGFKGLVFNMDESVLVTCSVGDSAEVRLTVLSSSHVFIRAMKSKNQILHLSWLLRFSLLSADG